MRRIRRAHYEGVKDRLRLGHQPVAEFSPPPAFRENDLFMEDDRIAECTNSTTITKSCFEKMA